MTTEAETSSQIDAAALWHTMGRLEGDVAALKEGQNQIRAELRDGQNQVRAELRECQQELRADIRAVTSMIESTSASSKKA